MEAFVKACGVPLEAEWHAVLAVAVTNLIWL